MELISNCITAIENIDKQIVVENKEEERSWRKKENLILISYDKIREAYFVEHFFLHFVSY